MFVFFRGVPLISGIAQSKLFEKLKNVIKVLVGQGVLELLKKTCKTLL